MSLGKKLFHQDAAAAADADATQGLVLHLDANDEDSIEQGGANDGNTNGTWFDISTHDLVTPLADKSSNLILNLDGGVYTSGAWEDQTTNTNNAALNGNAAYNSDVRGYFTLDGTGDYLQISDNSSLNLGAATYEMWFRQPSYAADEHFFGRFEAAGDNRDFFVRTSGTSGAVDATFYNGSTAITQVTSSNGSYNANEWSHFAVTLAGNTSGSAVKLYVNGTLQGSSTLSANRITDAAADLYLGILGSGFTTQYEFTGDIGTTRIYNVALTPSEIAQNFRAGNFLSYSSIYTTDLDMNLDAANYTSGTWDDTITSNSATVTDALFDKELGNFFTFDGATSAGDRIEFPHDATLNQGADISWEVWVKRDDTGIGTILHKGTASSGTFQYFFYYNSAYGYLWYSYAQGGGIYSGNAATTVGVWEHVVFTNDSSGNGKMYVNGELTTSSTLGARGAPTASVTNTNVLNIGGYDALNGNNGHDGEIGVVRFYDTALSAAQVAQNYLATKNDYPNGNHATNNGAIFTYSSTPYYFNFDGSNDYFSTNLIKNWASVHWSVEVWFNTDVRADDYLWGMTDSSGYGVSVSLRSSNNSYNIFLIGVGNISAGVYNSGQWYQLVYTSDGTTRKAYLNGSFVNSGTAGIDSRANGKPFTIGRYGNYSGGYYDGKVGLVRVFDKELTASEVTANYDADKATYGLS